jgi:glycine/D-amino acid oxidase-like deaminating enzyme
MVAVPRETLTGTARGAREIDRRDFLRATAAAVSLISRPSSGARQGRGKAVDPVVVVGAGLAGLRAADVLHRAGAPVVVLEARSRPGGRVHTIRAPFGEGLYAEAGAYASRPARTVIQLAKEPGLNLVPFGSLGGSALITIRGVTAGPDELKEGRRAAQVETLGRGLDKALSALCGRSSFRHRRSDHQPRRLCVAQLRRG